MVEKEIPLDLIDPNPFQPRQGFDPKKIEGLAKSIEKQGLLHKIEARPHGKRFQLSHGEYRVKAFEFLKRKKILADVKRLTDLQMMIRAYVENVHRTNLNSVEREESVHTLSILKNEQGNDIFKTQKALADELGFTSVHIKRLIDAYEFRRRHSNTGLVSTRTIDRTKGLCDSDRLKIVNRVQKGSIDAQDVESFVSAIKNLESDVRREVINKKLSAEDAAKISKTPKGKQEQLTEFIVGVRKEGEQLENFVVAVAQETSDVKTISLGSNVDDIFDRYINFYSSAINFELKDVLSLPDRMQQSVLNRVRGVMDFLRGFEQDLSREVEGVKIVKTEEP